MIEGKLDEIAAALAVVLKALAVRVPPEKETPRMPNDKAEALKAKVREKKTVFDGLVAARADLEAKLNEARSATGMEETNAAIDEALAMLDAFVDPAAKTSPVVEGTTVEGTPEAAPAQE